MSEPTQFTAERHRWTLSSGKWSRTTRVLHVVVGVLLIGTPTAVAAGKPRLPTELAGKQGLQVRPYAVGITGDGTGYLGGFTGHGSVRQPSRANLKWAGRIRWSVWSSSEAEGSGALWLNDGIPDDAQGTFLPHAVTIKAFKPRSGVFTRMTLRYHLAGKNYNYTMHATYYPGNQYGPGYWEW